MPYMQRTRVLMDSDLDDDATWRRRIDLAGQVTALELRINCNRYADRTLNTAVYTLEDLISRIELLKDATTPLVSLTGEQLDAMNYWDFKRPTARRYRQGGDTDNILSLFLLGGRDLYDREYGWDFDRLNKVYLEYTYDLSEGVADYFKADDHDIAIYAWQWKGVGIPKFKGFFRSRQLDAWTTTAADAEHSVEIPAANPIRRIGVQAKTRARTIGATLKKLEVRVDKGAYSPVIIPSPMNWVHVEVEEYGLENLIGGIDFAVANTRMDLPRYWSYLQDADVNEYGLASAAPNEVEFMTLPWRYRGHATTGGELTFSGRGFGFQKCLRIGFDHEYDGYDLLKVPAGKALDLICTENDSARAVAVFVQDVISY